MTFDPKTIRKGDAVTLTVIVAEPADDHHDLRLLGADGEPSDYLYAQQFSDGTYRDVTVKRAPRPIEVGDRVRGYGYDALTVESVSPCGRFAAVLDELGRNFPAFTADLRAIIGRIGEGET